MRMGPGGLLQQTEEGEKKVLNSELWHACAGPLVFLPPVGSHVVYFPQGHSEQVAASTNKEVDSHIPNYPNLPPQLICQLHDVTMHADAETDEVYAQMTLQPLTPGTVKDKGTKTGRMKGKKLPLSLTVSLPIFDTICSIFDPVADNSYQEQKDVCILPAGMGTPSKQPTNYFCKTLTASDTSTHGGFSVPRRAAEKVFPPLDYTQQPPCQELIARDLHDNEWKFRHIFRGQPKRHLLTTGWSVFVSAKRLVAGDSVIFIWNEKNELFLGIRRANRSQMVMPSSVLSSDSMHIGLLAAAAHAAATNSRFTIFFNPRASPSEFVVPLAKFAKAVYQTRVSVGMRFRMLFETEESSVRRYMGTITGISDLDPVRWPNSHWRSVKVGWDESTAGERQPRVSLWEIEPLTTFPMYPSPFSLRLKRPWSSALPSFPVMKDGDLGMSSPLMWLQNDSRDCYIPSLNFQGYGLMPRMQPKMDPAMLGLHPDIFQTMVSPPLSDPRSEKRPNHSLLQFQHHNPNMSYHPTAMLQQAQLTLPQNLPQNQTPALNPVQNQSPAQNQAPSQLLQQQLRNCHSYDQQHQPQQEQELPHYEQLCLQYSDQQSAISSTCPQQFFSNSLTQTDLYSMHSSLNSFSQVGGIRQYTMPESNPLVSSSLLSKQVAVEPQVSASTVQCSLPRVEEELGAPQTRVSELSPLLPPLPTCGREFSIFQDIDGPQSNSLFGVGSGNVNDSLPIPFSDSTFPSVTGNEFPPGSDMSATSCIDESGYLRSLDNADQGNQPTRTFVKVHKMGSFGRSLDISQFSSYQELRSELARMFGLENELEDSLRSGWQLVFVDRENDILLVGDDPWQEFVKTVGYIRILSPQEVQQMGRLPNSDSKRKVQHNHSVSVCNDLSGPQELRNERNMISSVTTLDY